MICIPHQARQVLPLIIYSWVHCTHLCIIHQAFLSTEQVFLIHTRHHFKLTRKAFLPKLHPLIGHFWSFQPSAATGKWHSGLSPHSYYLVALPTNVKKCYGCGDMFAEKFRQTPHNIVVKHVDRRVVRRDDNTGALVYSTDFTNTCYHPNPAHIRRKNPVFDGRVLIDLGTYQSLDEGQKEILK